MDDTKPFTFEFLTGIWWIALLVLAMLFGVLLLLSLRRLRRWLLGRPLRSPRPARHNKDPWKTSADRLIMPMPRPTDQADDHESDANP